jgi:DNA-binding NarL/FixJ family response regulator
MSRILIVDDEPAIRQILSEFLGASGYQVGVACDGEEGLQRALAEDWDLVLSDISMPRRNGIELLSELARLRPNVHRVLLTAHTIEEFIGEFLDHELSCVLTKSVPFPLAEILDTVQSLLSRRIFGIERHVLPGTAVTRHSVRSHADIVLISDAVSALTEGRRRIHLCTILNEILTNAVYYGVRNEQGDRKETWSRDFELAEPEAVLLETAHDGAKLAITITDPGGRLDRKTVLHWLHRQLVRDDNGLPKGIFDNHGRGFFISRSFSDRLSISIEKGKRCEVTLVLWDGAPPLGEKPLMILEI